MESEEEEPRMREGRGGKAAAVISRNFDGNREIALTREEVKEDGSEMSRCFKGFHNFRLNARIPLFTDLPFHDDGEDVRERGQETGGDRDRGKRVNTGEPRMYARVSRAT